MLVETDDLKELIKVNRQFKEPTVESERALLLMEHSIQLVENAAKALNKRPKAPKIDFNKPIFIIGDHIPN